MSTLRQRWLSAVAAVVMLGAAACSERPRDATDAVADTMTTPTMRRDLSADFRAAEQELKLAEDSVDAALGPELSIRLQPLRESFVAYRQQQCASLKAVFKGGTFGPVAELECLIHLTDSRREFIAEHYDFLEQIDRGRPSANAGRRKPR